MLGAGYLSDSLGSTLWLLCLIVRTHSASSSLPLLSYQLTVHTDLRGFCFPCHQIFKYTPSILKPSSQFNPLSACLQLSCGEIHQAIPGIGCTLWGYKCCGILDFCNFGHDPGIDANHRFFCKPVMDRHDAVFAVARSLGIPTNNYCSS